LGLIAMKNARRRSMVKVEGLQKNIFALRDDPKGRGISLLHVNKIHMLEGEKKIELSASELTLTLKFGKELKLTLEPLSSENIEEIAKALRKFEASKDDILFIIFGEKNEIYGFSNEEWEEFLNRVFYKMESMKEELPTETMYY